MEYPKIETLFNRDEAFKVVKGQLRCLEFSLIKEWLITEKIDGTNVRIHWDPGHEKPRLNFYGRTDNADMHPTLRQLLEQTFTPEKMYETFPGLMNGSEMSDVWLFGEGYGPKIQGGGAYRTDVGFRLFDVLIGRWWLNWDNVCDVAKNLDISPVPVLELINIEHAVLVVEGRGDSVVAKTDGGTGREWEGIVARTDPLLFMRNGERLMWKLKGKDFTGGKR